MTGRDGAATGTIAAVPQIALELLRLLAEDAPAAAIEEQADALAAADPQHGVDARAYALRVRAGIDARRRREVELSALVDTAHDLASRLDPGGVLDAIVRRARALLGTDVAYLTLADPERGDTYMRATAGSVSACFQSVRLPPGAGLGGLVAQTRRPYWSADYPRDDRFAHTSDIDAAVTDEGLIAICGTPLLDDGRFVGVLFAADRSTRAFHHDEVALLGSLAALAAVSLVQTRRAAETSEALAALSAAHHDIEQAVAAHDRFAGVVVGGGGVEDIAAALGETLSCWVAVLDADDQRLASYGAAPDAGAGVDPLAGAPVVLRTAHTGRLARPDPSDVPACDTAAVAVTAAGQRLGTLVLGGRRDLDDAQGRTVERAATVTALVLLFELRAAESDHRMRTDLLVDLLTRADGDHDPGLLDRGRVLGLRARAPHVVAVCLPDPDGRTPRLTAAALRTDLGSGACLAAEHRGAVVVLVPGTDPAEVARSLARPAGGPGQVTVGAAGPVTPADGIGPAYRRARRTAQALLALGMSGSGGSEADLGFAGLVGHDGALGDSAVGDYLTRVLGPLLDYDAHRDTDLIGTVGAYFATGTSLRRTAQQLHVHVNTVTQRLERVTALLGAQWRDPERALEIQLALRLRAVRSG